MSLVSIKNVSKEFFGTYANKDINLEIESGEIIALLGENGAGKTTLMNILYGIYQKDSGNIFINDKEVNFTSPKEAIDNSIGMVHQHFTLVPTLSVEKNITLGEKFKGYPFIKTSQREEKIAELSKKYNFGINPKSLIRTLSVGQQQRVEILKLLYRKAKLLILDEPTAVLTPQETQSLFKVLKQLKQQGNSIILITHRISEVLEIADRTVVLRDGEKVLDEKTAKLNEHTLSTAMINRELKQQQIKYLPQEEIILKLDNVSTKGKGMNLSYLSLNVHKGEILGIAGVDGNGQKALAEAIVGIRKTVHGNILVENENINSLNTEKRKETKIAYISDDRHNDGLLMDFSLEENLLLKGNAKETYYKNGILDNQKLKEDTEKAISDYKIKTYSTSTPVRLLSGGNQQKLILSREVGENIPIIIAFQPTRGLDVGASETVHDKLYEKQKEGCAILLISTDMEELRKMSNRIAVIHSGMIMGIEENDENLNLTKIGLMMAGTGEKDD